MNLCAWCFLGGAVLAFVVCVIGYCAVLAAAAFLDSKLDGDE